MSCADNDQTVNSEPIRATYTFTRDEYLRALRRHYRSRIHVYRDLVLAAFLIVLGAYLVYSSPPNWLFGWFLIALGLILLLMVAYALVILPALIFRSDPKLKWEYSLTFDDDKIEFKTNNIDSTLGWQLYHSWLRDDEFYILYHGKRDLSVIPRRVLSHDNSDERFAELLTRKIGPPLTVSYFAQNR
jgi:hypothetical protein